MDRALMISGNSPEEIARGLEIFCESYYAAKIKTIEPVSEDQVRVNTRQAAKFAGVSVTTFNKWVREGKINYYGSNKMRFFFKSEIIEAIKNGK